MALNSVRARLAARAEDWPWSSVRAHIAGKDDELVKVKQVRDRVRNFTDLLPKSESEDFTELRRAEGTGRPVGADDFVKGLERLLGRPIACRAPGRKPESVVIEQMSLLG